MYPIFKIEYNMVLSLQPESREAETHRIWKTCLCKMMDLFELDRSEGKRWWIGAWRGARDGRSEIGDGRGW
jgi:hypothetical protein